MRYSINSVLRTDKKIKQNGKLPIHFLVSFQNRRLKVATGKEVEPNKSSSKISQDELRKLQQKRGK